MLTLVTITIAAASTHRYLQFIMPALIFGFFEIANTGEKSISLMLTYLEKNRQTVVNYVVKLQINKEFGKI